MSRIIAGKPVGPVGFGMIPLMNPLNAISTADAVKLLKAALTAGSNFWNAGTHYGTPEWNSLHLLKAYFEKYPADVDRVVVCVKGGFDRAKGKPNATAEGVRESVEECLGIIDGVYRIDVFEPARLDPDVSVEETIGAAAEFVAAGKIRGIGISECSAVSLRKAAAVAPIAMVEMELSLFETTVLHDGVADACRELKIPIVAYSPLGRGFLTGRLRKYEDMAENDFRRMMPRFSKENFANNMKLVESVETLAKRKDCTTGQIALSWVSKQSDTVNVPVVPIPGTSSLTRLEENINLVTLSEEEMRELNAIMEKEEVKGERYPPGHTKYLNV
jgi:pyridoxine 4-dehydrogenase